MKIIFAGSPKFALPAFKALLESQHKICAVYTQPDKPAGRGLQLTASPVKRMALAANVPVYQPRTFKDEDAQKKLQSLAADVLVDVAFGLLLPKVVLETPRFGCVNIHPSLLPRWRGAAPIQRAILAGDTVTGVTIMQIDEGLDTGPIYKQSSMPISAQDTTAVLEPQLAQIGAKLLLEVLDELGTGRAQPRLQDENLACYAHKITKEEARINWQKSVGEIERMVRAFNPWPIAYSEIGGEILRIFKAVPLFQNSYALPGTIVASSRDGVDVAAADGILRILEMQLPGGRILAPQEILNAKKDLFSPGKKLV